MALDRWSQWATIIGLPVAVVATVASVIALHPHSTPVALTSSGPSASGPASTPASLTASASPSSQSATAVLESHASPAFASTCRPLAADIQTTGLSAAVECFPAGNNMPGSVQYYQYDNAADMNTAFGNYAGGAAVGGSCSDQAGARGTYHLNSSGANVGSWACYVDSDNRSVMMWTNINLNILSMALSTTATPQDLYNWFFDSGTDPGPD